MEESLIALGLRSQTVLGGIQFILISIFGITLIAFLKSIYNREAFTCEPDINSITKQLCYDEYSSAMNQWFPPLYFVVLTYVVLVVLSISFMLYGALTLRQIERDRKDNNNQSTKADSFKRAYLLHVRCRLIFIVVMIGIFCVNQTLILPKTYKCSVAAVTTPIPLNQTETDLHCHDQHYREKSICNISIIAIEVFIMILCIIEFIQVKRLTPPKNLLIKLLGDIFDVENNNLLEVTTPDEEKVTPDVPKPEEENVKPDVPKQEEETVKPDVPKPNEEKVKPDVPTPDEEKVKPDVPKPEEEKVKPDVPKPEEENVKPDVPKPNEEKVKPDDIELVVRRRESPLGLPPPSPDSVPTGEELWKALKCDPVDKQRVESLLKSHAPVNFREPGSRKQMRRTPLHFVLFEKNGDDELIQMLLAYGADTNLGDDDDFTPLHLAAEKGNLMAVRRLVMNGADRSKRSRLDETPAELAKRKQHDDVWNYLTSA